MPGPPHSRREGGIYENPAALSRKRLGVGMTAFLPDAPVAIVVIHLVMLSTLLVHTAVVKIRRRYIIRQSREGTPSSLWARLLFSLGFLK